MALSFLQSREMAALTRTWVDPAHRDHRTILARPLMAPLMPEFKASHHDILSTQPLVDISERLSEIQVEQADVDKDHDRYVRGIHDRLLAEERLATDPAVAARFRKLRMLLFPDGKKLVNLTYREEVGHGEMIAALLTPEDQQLLERLTTYDSNLHVKVDEWLSLANRLGELDHERNGLLPQPQASNRAAVVKARYRWMRSIDLARRIAEVAGEDPELAELLGRISKAEEQAAARRAQRAGTDTPTDIDAGLGTNANTDTDDGVGNTDLDPSPSADLDAAAADTGNAVPAAAPGNQPLAPAPAGPTASRPA